MPVRFPGFIRRLIRFGGGVSTDSIEELTTGHGVTIEEVTIEDNSIVVDTLLPQDTDAGISVDGCLIKGGRVAGLATGSMFMSGEQTGTGSPQAIAHGMGASPLMYWACVTEDPAGSGFDVGAIVPDATNLTLTVTSGIKYRVFALK